jgi:glycerophosphoryl diester phosphodiesterase
MYITAHGGAMRTGRNSKKFFEAISEYDVDIIEVDVRRRADVIYISHMPALFYKRALSLGFVFEYIKNKGFKVNCDLKCEGLAESVVKLAKTYGVADKLIFTGETGRGDLKNLSGGDVYLNAGFFKGIKPAAETVKTFKEEIVNLNCPLVKGVNIDYKYCSEEFILEAEKNKLDLSVYTVDDREIISRLMKSQAVVNITTNTPDVALSIRDGLGGGR